MLQAKRLHLGLAGSYLLASIALGIVVYDHFQAHSPVGLVAVVDLNEIANKLGTDKQLDAAVALRADKLNQELVIVRQQLESQIATVEKKATASPEGKEAASLPALRKQADKLMADANRSAVAKLNSYRIQLVSQFRQQSQEVAGNVARERGISLVVEKSELLVVDYELAIDISDQVVEQSAVQLALAVEPSTKNSKQ